MRRRLSVAHAARQRCGCTVQEHPHHAGAPSPAGGVGWSLAARVA